MTGAGGTAMTQPRSRIRRIVIRTCRDVTVGVSVLSAVLWVGSALFGSIGMFSLGPHTTLRFAFGAAEVRHVFEYNIGPTASAANWQVHATKMGWVTPARPMPMLPPIVARLLPGNFHYSAGSVMGVSDGKTVSPARYWLLDVPLWATMLPGGIVAVRLFALRQRKRREQGRGFSVVGDPRRALPVAPDPGAVVHS
jgi:hypothetical protein